jgi:hypothetical protein
MKRLAMAGVVAVAAVMALPLESRAADWGVRVALGRDDREWHGPRGDWRGADPAFRHGYDRGWRNGTDEGHTDGRRSRDPRFWREDDFRDADSGYKRWMGPRSDFVRGYREGYATGYRRAYAAARPGWRDRGWDRDRGRSDDRGRWNDGGAWRKRDDDWRR